MATSTIKTQLQLDSSEYQKKIKDAKQSLEGFKKMGSGLATSLGKLAGTIGIAVTSFSTMKEMVASTQTTSDAWENTVNSMRDTLDSFLRSLVSADFTPFQDGILATIERFKELSSELDDINDMKLSLGFIEADDMADIRKFQEEARDTSNSITDRINAAQNMGGVVGHLETKTKAAIDKELKYLNHEYAAKSGLNISGEDLTYFFKNTNYDSSMAKQANSTYKDLVTIIIYSPRLLKAATEIEATGDDPMLSNRKKASQLKEQADLYYQQNTFLIKQGWLTEEGDENRLKTLETLKQQRAEMEKISVLQMQVDKADKAVHQKTLSGISVAKVSSVPKAKPKTDDIRQYFGKSGIARPGEEASDTGFSIDFYEKAISNERAKLGKATDDTTRQEIQKRIDDLEAALKYIQGIAKINPEAELTSLKDIGLKSAKNPTESLEGAGDALRNIGSPFSKEDIKTNKSFAGSLNDIATVMGNLSGNIGEGASNWIKWGANLLTSIAAAIPAIGALTVKQKGLANASMESAVAGAASSNSSIPIVGAILAAASVATVIAAIMSAPKFASGGIVPGGMTIGDNVWARLNSGELILNKAQQNNIAGQLSSPSSRMEITVKGEIDGRKLKILSDKVNRYYSRM